jgi:hypothetical protein
VTIQCSSLFFLLARALFSFLFSQFDFFKKISIQFIFLILGFVSYDNPQCAQQGKTKIPFFWIYLNSFFCSHTINEWISNWYETFKGSIKTPKRFS